MATIIKKAMPKNLNKLPRKVKQQLNRIYSRSVTQVKKHPYQTASGLFVTLGAATGALFLIRYLRNR